MGLWSRWWPRSARLLEHSTIGRGLDVHFWGSISRLRCRTVRFWGGGGPPWLAEATSLLCPPTVTELWTVSSHKGTSPKDQDLMTSLNLYHHPPSPPSWPVPTSSHTGIGTSTGECGGTRGSPQQTASTWGPADRMVVLRVLKGPLPAGIPPPCPSSTGGPRSAPPWVLAQSPGTPWFLSSTAASSAGRMPRPGVWGWGDTETAG